MAIDRRGDTLVFKAKGIAMKVLIIGAAGMIGRKVTDQIVQSGRLGGKEVTGLCLLDVTSPETPVTDIPTTTRQADLSTPGIAEGVAGTRADVIIHLAAIPSGGAEADFEGGYRANLDGTFRLFRAIYEESKKQPYCPKLIFSSTIAVFGAPFPEKIGDDFLAAPLTSYGAQKAASELILSDLSRRGVIDGLAIRLPTICIRPGLPNAAASGFFSNILREPLVGEEAVLPVSEDIRHWFAGPRSAVGFVDHAVGMDLSQVGPRRALNMPGLSATVGEEIAALERIGGMKASSLIRREHDPVIAKIVDGWPRDFETTRALELGFRAESSFDEIIRAHIDDELGGSIPVNHEI